jgi:hypothetical protein
MALTHIDGWEHGHITGWAYTATNGPAISSSVFRTGAYSARFYKTSSSTCYLQKSITTTRVFVARVYVRFDAWPNVDEIIYRTSLVAGDAPALRLNVTTSQIEAMFGANVGNACATVLQLNTWYRIDLKFDVTANPSAIDFQVDGVAATQSTQAQAATYPANQYFGAYTAGTFDMFMDDLACSITAGDYPIGPGGVVGLSPNAAGTSSPGNYVMDNADDIIDDATNPANVELDDVPMTSATDYIKQTAIDADLYAEVLFADTAEATIHGVSGHVAYRSSGSTPANSAIAKILDSNNQESVIKSGDMSETTQARAGAMVAVPSGGWTMAHVNALRGRVGFASNVDVVPYWDAMMLQVAYAAAAGANPLLKIINE